MPQDYFVTQGTTVSTPAGGTTDVVVGTICGSMIDIPPAPSRAEATQQGISLPQYEQGWAPPEATTFIRTAIDLARDGKLSGGGLISDEEYLQTVVEVGAGWGPAAAAAGKTFTQEDFIKHIEQRIIASGGRQTREDTENLATAVFSGVDLTQKQVVNYERAMKEVIAKALTDDDFRKQLLSNPKSTLAKYDLTDEQKKAFENFDEKRLALMSHIDQAGWGMAM